MSQFNIALNHQQAGRLDEARLAYLQLIDSEPNHWGAFANLGVIFFQTSKPGSEDFLRGIFYIKRSLHCNEMQPIAHANLGNALATIGEFEESDVHYQSAIRYAPDRSDVYINRAILLSKYKGFFFAKDWLSNYQLKFSEEAAFNLCLGGLFLDSGDYKNALALFDKAISLNSRLAEAWYNRGNALRMLRRHDEALVSYRRCLRLRPDFVEAYINMGVLQQDLKQFDAAVDCYDAALKLRPHAMNACYNRALALENMGRFEEAVAGYGETIGRSPAYPYLSGRRHHVQMQMCDWVGYSARQQLVCAGVESGFPTSVPFPFLAISDDLNLQRLCAETFSKDKFPMGEKLAEIKADRRQGRIRVGYFSPDFRTHAVGFLTAGLFEKHNGNDFEVFAVSLGSAPETDIYRSRIAGAVEHFIDASTMTDGDVVALARSLELDIAVDLAGHTMDARTAIFAQRVAQVQVNYLGYPGSMGAPYMDVILADEVVVPLGVETEYTEQVVRLAQTFQINDDQRPIGELQTLSHYGLPEQRLVFASFNTSYKITPPLFDTWCRLLQRAPESVLWLFGENQAQIANLRREASSRGVAPERLIFAARIAYTDHLARYAHVDLVLDTLPFNGGTSTSDALWGGAPVLTCMGKSFAGRMSASLLRAVGLPELITESLEDYEVLGEELASDTSRLADIKVKLQANRLQCPLFDTLSQTRDIENAYREMLARSC